MSARFYCGLIYFIAMVGLTAVRIIFGLADFSKAALSEDRIFTILTQVVCLGIIPLSLYLALPLKGRRGKIKALTGSFGFTRPDTKQYKDILIISVLAFFISSCTAVVWRAGLKLIGYNFGASSSSGTLSPASLPAELLLTALLPAIFEEFTSRGLLLPAFGTDTDNGKRYIILSAALFALMHQNIVQTGYTFVGGLVMAALVVRTKSLWPAIFYHFFNNALSVIGTLGFWPLDLLNRFLSGSFGIVLSVALFIFAVRALLRRLNRIKPASAASQSGAPATGNVQSDRVFIDPDLTALPVRSSGFADEALSQPDALPADNGFYPPPHSPFMENTDDFYADTPSAAKGKTAAYDNIFFYAAILLNTAATVYSLIWGLML